MNIFVNNADDNHADVPPILREAGEIVSQWDARQDSHPLAKNIDENEGHGYENACEYDNGDQEYLNAEQTIATTPQFDLTPYGNAKRLVHHFGKNIRFCEKWRKWLVWDGTRWIVDERRLVESMTKKTVLAMLDEAKRLKDSPLEKYALKSQSRAMIKEMLELAKSEEGMIVSTDELDADLNLLNCINGTLDLRTGELMPHDRYDFITKLCPVAYEPDATCPLFKKFLPQVMGSNENLIHYLRRAVGYSLTGSNQEQVFFVLHGSGQNGKSVFLSVMEALLGDYGQTAPPSAFLVKSGNGIPNDIAKLRGSRFVAAVETEEGSRLAEVLMKRITGGDRIACRFLFQEYFEYTPTFKIFVATNHLPEIRGTDEGIWRRIHTIPFSVKIREDEKDRNLVEKLKQELPGILAWAVQGCQEWREQGLGLPHEIKTATTNYREEMDTFKNFLDDRCEIQPDVEVTSGKLYEEYKNMVPN